MKKTIIIMSLVALTFTLSSLSFNKSTPVVKQKSEFELKREKSMARGSFHFSQLYVEPVTSLKAFQEKKQQ